MPAGESGCDQQSIWVAAYFQNEIESINDTKTDLAEISSLCSGSDFNAGDEVDITEPGSRVWTSDISNCTLGLFSQTSIRIEMSFKIHGFTAR